MHCVSKVFVSGSWRVTPPLRFEKEKTLFAGIYIIWIISQKQQQQQQQLYLILLHRTEYK